MPIQLVILLIITVALPIVWAIAEFRSRPIVRRIIGLVAILWSFAVAALAGGLQVFNANSYFTAASKDLLETSVQQLRAGKTEAVIRELEHANDQFNPTYENRGKYKEIVDQAVKGMKKP